MKTLKIIFFLSLIVYQTSSISQTANIVNVIVSPIDETTINVKSIVHFLYLTEYFDHEIIIETNTINLNLCYEISILTLEDTVMHNNPIDVTGLSGEYTLNINIFDNSGGCYINVLDTATLLLPLPLEGEVVLLSNPIFNTSSFKIYPNPVKEILFINTKENIAIKTIKVYDILGKLVLEENNLFTQLNLSTLDSGLFLVKIETDKGIGTKKIVKE